MHRALGIDTVPELLGLRFPGSLPWPLLQQSAHCAVRSCSVCQVPMKDFALLRDQVKFFLVSASVQQFLAYNESSVNG